MSIVKKNTYCTNIQIYFRYKTFADLFIWELSYFRIDSEKVMMNGMGNNLQKTSEKMKYCSLLSFFSIKFSLKIIDCDLRMNRRAELQVIPPPSVMKVINIKWDPSYILTRLTNMRSSQWNLPYT